mmetsp:Transcript_4772/g.10253  ORF Transcript_4772/g.10253 Transcript_4772/m.10253 type:complete len:583 (+) Transcript_4772:116-1864(+)
MSSNENWVLGVTLGLLGSIAINTGNNIQSLGLKSIREKVVPSEKDSPSRKTSKRYSLSLLSPTKSQIAPSYEDEGSAPHVGDVGDRSPIGSIIWLLGTFIFVSGSLLNFASYAFAAQSMLASLESVQFVTNLLFGKFLLGAQVTRAMFGGTFLTVVGTVLAVQFSSKETLDLNTNEMKMLYCNPAYLIYLAIMVILLFALRFLYDRLEELKSSGKPIRYSDVVMPCVYSIWSALVGTQSVVQAKVLAELLAVQSSGTENVFESWFTYATIIVWLATVIVWLKRLNDALSKFDPLFIIPLLQCSFIFFAIVSGGIFFQEFDTFDESQWVGFWFGIIIMFSGLVLLTPKPSNSDDDDNIERELVNIILANRASNISSKSIESYYSKGAADESPGPNSNAVEILRTTDDESMASTCEVDYVRENPSTVKPVSRENRAARFSSDQLYSAAKDAVMDIMRESVNLFDDPTKRILSDAMMAAAFDEERRLKRRMSLEKLLALLKEDPVSSNDKGYSTEVIDLIRDLKFDAVLGPISEEENGIKLNVSAEILQTKIITELEEDSIRGDRRSRNLESSFDNEVEKEDFFI